VSWRFPLIVVFNTVISQAAGALLVTLAEPFAVVAGKRVLFEHPQPVTVCRFTRIVWVELVA
jgi:hypothetical protein